MAAQEHQPQYIIFDMIDGRQEVVLRHLVSLCLSDSGIDLITVIASSELINCPALGRRHEPSAGVVWDPGFGPLCQRCDQCILGEVLGQPNTSYDPDQPGNQPRRFQPPDRFDGLLSGPARHTVDQITRP